MVMIPKILIFLCYRYVSLTLQCLCVRYVSSTYIYMEFEWNGI